MIWAAEGTPIRHEALLPAPSSPPPSTSAPHLCNDTFAAGAVLRTTRSSRLLGWALRLEHAVVDEVAPDEVVQDRVVLHLREHRVGHAAVELDAVAEGRLARPLVEQQRADALQRVAARVRLAQGVAR